jgi:recombination protein RecA
MDDGSFTLRSKGVQQRTEGGTGRIEICLEAMSLGTRDRIVEYLRDTHGFDVKLTVRGARQISVLQFSTAATTQFQELIAPYVHPSMEYKLLPRFRGQFAVVPQFAPAEMRPVPARIIDVRVKPKTRSMSRFDIEVEGNHNYFVDGVMVHNSPETTTGGKALKFYASIRLDVRRIETMKDGGEAVGNRTRVKVVKNKCLAEGTHVFDPTSGLTHRIEDVVDQRLPIHVVASDKKGELHIRPVVSWFDQGSQEVIGLRLDGTELWVTPDHKVLTADGWRLAGQLTPGDRVARPREFLGFGTDQPVPAEHARLLGYLIGDGYVGGKTPIHFINVAPPLIDDAAKIASDLGCSVTYKPAKISVAFSHRPGTQNGVLSLCRTAGIWGGLAYEKKIPAMFFAAETSAEVVANLIFGLFETDGHVSREKTGGIRVGFTTTSKQLAHQIHWLLLRWGIGSNVRSRSPRANGGDIAGRRIVGRRPVWEVRLSGIDNVSEFAEAIPMWGPRGTLLQQYLEERAGRYRASQRVYVLDSWIEPVLEHLRQHDVTPGHAAALIGEPAGDPKLGMRAVLGMPRMRRDRLERLATALDSAFLREVLVEQVWYSTIREVLPARQCRTFDVEVEELHNLVAEDLVVHNCAPPFKQAEFDILYGFGISREGSLIDMGVEQAILRKSGAWYTYEGDQLGQGKENARRFLKENPDVANEVEKRIKEKLGIGPKLDSEEAPGPVDF